MPPEIPGISRSRIESTMQRARIPGVCIASTAVDIEQKRIQTSMTIGKTAFPDERPIEEDTVFGAASLSKPVFAYLVLKLIERHRLPDVNGRPFDLDTPLSEILPLEEYLKDKAFNIRLSPKDIERAKSINASMVLSHSSGISDFDSSRLHFKPGTEYEYSGMGMIYLQKILEMQTGKSLEALAQEEVFNPIGMTHSSYMPPDPRPKPHYMEHTISSTAKIVHKLQPALKPPIAANSLHTTAADYAKFMSEWMDDPSELMQSAFIPKIYLTEDRWARDIGVNEDYCSHLAWGLGIGLELDDAGDPVRAFHTGDMNQWRGWCAMNLERDKPHAREGIVYFANGRHHRDANGHVLSDVIVAPKIDLPHAQNWFFQKFGFARDVSPGWEVREKANMSRIGEYLAERKTNKTVNVKAEIKSEPLTQEKHKGLESSEEAQSPSHTSIPNPLSTRPKPPGWR